MITAIKLKNFKRFEQLEVNGLTQVNLLAGRNNSGKTGILEAILLSLGNRRSQCATTFRVSENQAANDEYASWFGRFGSDAWNCQLFDLKTLIGFGFGNLSEAKGVSTPELPEIHCVAVRGWPYSITEDRVAYEQLVKIDGMEQRFEDLLRHVEPELKTVRSLPDPAGKNQLYCTAGLGTAIPLPLLGHGVMRLSAIFSRALSAKTQRDPVVLLIDEIENGLHHSAMLDLWRGLKALVEQEDTQIFATTHSMECIRAASAVFGANSDSMLSLHRIEDVKKVPSAISIDAALLAGMLEDGFEIR